MRGLVAGGSSRLLLCQQTFGQWDAGASLLSDAAVAFDDEDPCLRGGVGDVFVAGFGVADATRGESLDVLASGIAVVHVDGTVQDGENLGAVVGVPGVGLVGPVQPHADAPDRGDVDSVPGPLGGVRTRARII